MIGLLSPGIAEIVIIIFLMLVPLIALIDILKSNFEPYSNNKLIWVLVVILLNLLGAILYFTIGRKQRIIPNK